MGAYARGEHTLLYLSNNSTAETSAQMKATDPLTRVKNGPGVMTGIVRELFAATKEESDEQAIGNCGSGARSALGVRLQTLPEASPRSDAPGARTLAKNGKSAARSVVRSVKSVARVGTMRTMTTMTASDEAAGTGTGASADVTMTASGATAGTGSETEVGDAHGCSACGEGPVPPESVRGGWQGAIPRSEQVWFGRRARVRYTAVGAR